MRHSDSMTNLYITTMIYGNPLRHYMRFCVLYFAMKLIKFIPDYLCTIDVNKDNCDKVRLAEKRDIALTLVYQLS